MSTSFIQTAIKLIFVALLTNQLMFGSPKVSAKNQSDIAKNEYWSHRFNVTHNIAYGDLPGQSLDIYRQGSWQGPPAYFVPNKKANRTLVYIHGGAWHGGSKEASLWSLMPFIQRGWNVVNLEYRSGGGTAPDAANDVALAMSWLADNAEKYQIDRENMVLSGDSAGGHLALYAGLKSPTTLKIKAIVNWFGITDIQALEHYLRENEQWNYPKLWAGSEEILLRLIERYSPINLLDKTSPPVISVHGTEDKVVPIAQAVSLHQKLNQLGIDNRLVKVPGGTHLGFSDMQFQTIYTEIFAFLASHSSKSE